MNPYTGEAQVNIGLMNDNPQVKLPIIPGNTSTDAVCRSKFRKTSVQSPDGVAFSDVKIEISNKSTPKMDVATDWVDISDEVTKIADNFVVIEFPFHIIRFSMASPDKALMFHIQSNK